MVLNSIKVQTVYNPVYNLQLTLSPYQLSQRITAITDYVHRTVLLTKDTHKTACNYRTQKFLYLKEPKQLHQKSKIICHISTLISLSQIRLHVFPLQFSTLNALHHTPFVNLSILAKFRAAVPRFW